MGAIVCELHLWGSEGGNDVRLTPQMNPQAYERIIMRVFRWPLGHAKRVLMYEHIPYGRLPLTLELDRHKPLLLEHFGSDGRVVLELPVGKYVVDLADRARIGNVSGLPERITIRSGETTYVKASVTSRSG